MMLVFTVTARSEFGVWVDLDVIAFAWPSVAYVTERVRSSVEIAMLGAAMVFA